MLFGLGGLLLCLRMVASVMCLFSVCFCTGLGCCVFFAAGVGMFGLFGLGRCYDGIAFADGICCVGFLLCCGIWALGLGCGCLLFLVVLIVFLLFVLGCAWSYGVAVCYGDDLVYLLREGSI